MSIDCEPFTIAVSSLIDGELPAERHLDVLDHLVGCNRCRTFYRSARALDRWTAAAEAEREGDEPLPDGLWQRIATAAATQADVGRDTAADPATPPPSRRGPSAGWRTWLPSLAAALLLAVGLWTSGVLERTGTGTPAPTLEVELEADRGRMTEDRFIALATEVLRADRRYHLEMFEIMSTVTAATGVREGDAGDRDRRAEPSERAPAVL